MLASLPPFFNSDQLFTCALKASVYKLNAIVFYTGSHYMVFIRTKNNQNHHRIWTLFNDTEIRQFESGLPQVFQYAVQARAIPTMVFYEKSRVQTALRAAEGVIATQPDVVWQEMLRQATHEES